MELSVKNVLSEPDLYLVRVSFPKSDDSLRMARWAYPVAYQVAALNSPYKDLPGSICVCISSFHSLLEPRLIIVHHQF